MVKIVIKQPTTKAVSHPVTARLVVQMFDAIKLSSLDKEIQDDVLRACMGDLQSRLGKCWDIWERLEVEQKRCNDEYIPSDALGIQIPQIFGIEREVDNFLYEAKNLLRDLLNRVVSRCFPDIDFSDASSFFDSKNDGDGPFVRWAELKFGLDDDFTKMLREDQEWIAELVRKRNSVEHPAERSGTLTVQNIEALYDGRIVAPIWQRTGTDAEFISVGMATYCQHLLSFAEEVIIFGCIQKSALTQSITFAEIPESDRDPKCPVRYQACFKGGVIQD
ncbi:MAG: hypothetical protein H8D75_01980 [Rhodospirillaceae bacterium]|nr:hypothetical protein [Rhodospirillaceae bacterium]MBL6953738.1 hypothetical protein [Alphaproteobacteria bacterium]